MARRGPQGVGRDEATLVKLKKQKVTAFLKFSITVSLLFGPLDATQSGVCR